MALVMVVAVNAKTKQEAEIKFEQTTHDFGNINEDGGRVSYEFVFTNTGTSPLKLESVRAECGCTTPEFPTKDIAPGEKGTIKVTYNPYGRPGSFIKKVTVRSNGKNPRVNLKIRGTVIPR